MVQRKLQKIRKYFVLNKNETKIRQNVQDDAKAMCIEKCHLNFKCLE